MLSRDTVMATAIVIMREAIENNRLQMDDNHILQSVVDGNIYGMYSDVTFWDTNADDLHEWYGCEVLELRAGLKYKPTDKKFQSSIAHMTGSEYISLADWGSIDSYIPSTPINELDEEDYEYQYRTIIEAELENAPHGVSVSQLAQVIDWAELWNDKDFTISTEEVAFLSADNLLSRGNEFYRVLDINAALSHYDLPTMDAFIDKKSLVSIPSKFFGEDFFYARHTQVFNDFIAEYLEKATVNPLNLRGIGYGSVK